MTGLWQKAETAGMQSAGVAVAVNPQSLDEPAFAM